MNFHLVALLRTRGRHVGATRVPLFIAGERLGRRGIGRDPPRVLLAAPGAYFPPDDAPPQGLLSPGKDEDGRRDGTRLKAPSQVLTRATRTTSVRHALDRRLRVASSRRLPSSSRWSSTFRTSPFPRLRGCSPRRRAFLARVSRAFAKMFWRAVARAS